MTILMISSLPNSGREDLAMSLGQKTGWPVLGREELVDRAAAMGIKTGRLELSVIKTPGMSERLAREKMLYLAFITASICEKAKDGNLIYHGRAGHLLLPGVSHRLRIGLTVPIEYRVRNAVRDLKITEEKAMAYIDHLDEDIEKWIRNIHSVDRREPSQYDLLINLDNMSAGNAATVICQMASLPDFQETPAGRKLMDDLYLEAQARLKLGFDPRTADAELEVRADSGTVTVIYPPRQEAVADNITKVLEDLEGIQGIQCTMAETNILWVQEEFDPKSENFEAINQLAQRWGAAVELLRYVPVSDTPPDSSVGVAGEENRGRDQNREPNYTGGVEDDVPEPPERDRGLIKTAEELISLGRFGGRHSVHGSHDRILGAAGGNYSLVVVGDMFLSKGHATRTRQTREFCLAIRDKFKAPVIVADELKSRFLFGPKQAGKLVVFAALTIFIYFLVFTHQDSIMSLVGGELHEKMKVLSSVFVALFVPTIAFIYATVTGLLLKLINMD